MKKHTFSTTRDVVRYCLKYVSGRTLDLGAGTAKYKNLIAPQTASYITLDLFSGENVDIVASVTDTGLADSSFDTIICTQVFEHIPEPWEAVREIHRLLKSGGTCVITAPFMQPYHADPHDYYRYTVEGMKALFSEGFELVECGPYTNFFTTVSEIIHHALLSPYEKNWLGKAYLVKFIANLACFFDKFVKVGRVYGNVYLVARKT
jgi:ubiquinone/menaquinone biosynthesis C-methylase UbiE